jgi:hypothetical protein
MPIPARPFLERLVGHKIPSIPISFRRLSLVVSAGTLMALNVPQAQAMRVLASDLSFHFSCAKTGQNEVGKELKDFLKSQGFDVLDLAQARRDRSIPTLRFEFIAVDLNRGIISIRSGSTQEYAVTLRTPPPTRRDSVLEEKLLKFVSERIGCRVRQVTEHSNGADAADLYSSEIRGILNEFREAAEPVHD